MPKTIEELLDTLTAGKSEYVQVTLKSGVSDVVKSLAKQKRMSRSDALNRIVAEWHVMRQEAETAETPE